MGRKRGVTVEVSRTAATLDGVMEESAATALDRPGLHGFLHRPAMAAGAEPRGLVLTHGAGSDCTAPLLVSAAKAFSVAGFVVLRCDLEFRQRRSSGPPSPATAAADRASLRVAAAALKEMVPGQIFLGGHSYGGRQATMLAAEEPGVADGLLLLSYPLHPPKKPDQLRTAHLPSLRTPALFVHGTRDAFGSAAEMNSAIRMIPSPTRFLTIEGAGHDLKGGRFDFVPVIAAIAALVPP